jgi:hypothetical protein
MNPGRFEGHSLVRAMRLSVSFVLLLPLASNGMSLQEVRVSPENSIVAKGVAQSFMKSLGHIKTDASPTSVTGHGSKQKVFFPGGAIVEVDREKKIVLSYENTRRIKEKGMKGRSRGTYAIRSDRQLRSVVLRLQRILRVPKDYALEGVMLYSGGYPRVRAKDANTIGSASFGPRPFGYGFLSYSLRILITIDPLDGALLTYRRFADSVIESSKVSVTASAARKIASKAVQFAGFSVGSTSKLGYTLPNGWFGSKVVSTGPPYRLRLAYEFPLRGRSTGCVWVDAGNGQVLGGWQMKNRENPERPRPG